MTSTVPAATKAVSTSPVVLGVFSKEGPAGAGQKGHEADSILEGSRQDGSRLDNTGSGAPCAPAQGELPILLLAGSNLKPTGIEGLVGNVRV